jgi:hypothetical protein
MPRQAAPASQFCGGKKVAEVGFDRRGRPSLHGNGASITSTNFEI